MNREMLYEQMKSELNELYGDVAPEKRIDWLVDSLCDVIMDDGIGLIDVSACVIEFEETLTREYESKYYDVFEFILDKLPKSKINADRLASFFIEDNRDFAFFEKLMDDFSKFLSDEQYQKVVKTAREVFDEETLSPYNLDD